MRGISTLASVCYAEYLGALRPEDLAEIDQPTGRSVSLRSTLSRVVRWPSVSFQVLAHETCGQMPSSRLT